MSNSFERVAADPFAAFAAFAEQHGRKPSRPVRIDGVRVLTSDAQAPMKPTAMEQAQRDQSAQFARYKKAKKADHQAMLHGANAAPYVRLLAILKRLPDSAVELVEHLHKGWLRCLAEQQRMVVLSMIDARIIRVRMTDGRPPFDDPLPGERDNLFLICRKIITGV